jgi:NDP-sugar pyrophosphorylase family protein
MNPRALVLTAGLGTRLRPLTYVRAKAAVPVNGEPLARRVIRWLVSRGHADLVLNLHHHPASITGIIGDGGDLGARVRYSWEHPVLGSAGGPRHALPLLTEGDAPTFLLVNGDTLTDVDLTALRRTHEESGALVTMSLIPNPRPDKYGGVRVSDDGWVTGFTRPGASAESFHFVGVQMADARAFSDLEDGVPAESVNALYPKLLAGGSRCIAGFVSDASFRDIGTPADCLHTSAELAAVEGDRMTAGQRTRIDDSARLARTAVWDDVTVERDASLTDCIIGDGVRIPEGARYERCAIVRAAERAAGDGERIEGELLIKSI